MAHTDSMFSGVLSTKGVAPERWLVDNGAHLHPHTF